MSFGSVVAIEHVGVGHARHGDVLVAFAASVAGVGHAHQAGGELVAEVALKNAVFDEDGLLGGRAFVIDVERTAPVGHGAVVDDGDFGAGYFLPDEAGEGGGFFAVEVGLEAVADCLVEEDAGPAGAEDYFHIPGRSGDRAELEDGLRAASWAKCSGVFSV